jgi:hypothetical protein
MIIREATSNDNEALLQLTELSPMDGVISLCIQRQPDFFALTKIRGESTVLVAVEQERIVGVFSASRQEVWVNKVRMPVYYIGDLKVHPAYRGSKIALELAQYMHGVLVRKKAKLLFCTTADGNAKVTPFFQGGAGLPAFEDIGLFRVLQILPTPFQPKINFTVTDCTGIPKAGDLISFYNAFFQKYQLGPVVTEQAIGSCRHLMLIENGKIKAAISLMDTSKLKQNVVHAMPWYLRIASSISNVLAEVLPTLRLPEIGEAIPIWNIRYFGYTEGSQDALLALIKLARKLAWEEQFLFLSIGLHERAAELPLFKKSPHITFTSHGMLTTFDRQSPAFEQVKAGVPFEDFTIV